MSLEKVGNGILSKENGMCNIPREATQTSALMGNNTLTMEDLIALEVVDKKRGRAAFLTWGRLFDRVDTSQIEAVVTAAIKKFGFSEILSIRVCDSLQEVASYRYFFEKFFLFSREPIPFGPKYKIWAAKKRRALKAGREIALIGFADKTRPRKIS
jgi:hypothetical protein